MGRLTQTIAEGSGLLLDELGNPLTDETYLVVVSERVLDFGLAVLADEADKIYLCNAEPTNYTEASSTFAVAVKDFGAPGGAFGAIAAGNPTGRKVPSTAITDGSVSASDTATYWAAVDSANSRLLVRGPVATPRAVFIGDVFTLPSFDLTMPGQ